MTRVQTILVAAGLALGVGGCVTPTAVVSTHTLAVGQHQEVDVVWLIAKETLYRCTGAPDKPTCVVVRELR